MPGTYSRKNASQAHLSWARRTVRRRPSRWPVERICRAGSTISAPTTTGMLKPRRRIIQTGLGFERSAANLAASAKDNSSSLHTTSCADGCCRTRD